MKDKENKSLDKRIYPVGTSGTTYMVFIGLSLLLIYLIIFLAPSFFQSNWWSYPLLIALYLFCFRIFRTKGEKLIVTGDSIEFKGLLSSKKLKVSEIASFKVMNSNFSGKSNIIIINPNTADKSEIKIGALPRNDLSEFIKWLESHVDRDEGLQFDDNKDQIVEEDGGQTGFNPSATALKSYRVGKKIFPMVLIVPISLSLVSGLILQLNLDHNMKVYLSIGLSLIIMISFIIYAMFVHTKLNILNDGVQLKGLFVNKKLKFNEIKGYKIEQSFMSQRIQSIVIIPNSNINKPIKIRPSAKPNFIELSDWIEKNFVNLGA